MTREYIELCINKCFLSTNNTSISFTILFSYQAVHKRLDYVLVLVDAEIEGSKYWILQLFTSLEKGI